MKTPVPGTGNAHSAHDQGYAGSRAQDRSHVTCSLRTAVRDQGPEGPAGTPFLPQAELAGHIQGAWVESEQGGVEGPSAKWRHSTIKLPCLQNRNLPNVLTPKLPAAVIIGIRPRRRLPARHSCWEAAAPTDRAGRPQSLQPSPPPALRGTARTHLGASPYTHSVIDEPSS